MNFRAQFPPAATRGPASAWKLAPLLVAAFFWLGLPACPAQSGTDGAAAGSNDDYLVDTWRSEDGLPQNSITSIAQTPDGYLWLATFNGLVRFDGVRFTVFDAVNTPELRSSRLVRLCADGLGQLWTVSEEGDVTALLHGHLTHVGTNYGLPSGKIEFLGPDPSGSIWVRSARDGRLFRMKNSAFVPAEGVLVAAINTDSRLSADTLENLWLSDGTHWHSVQVTNLDQIGFQLHGLKCRVKVIGPARGGGIWFGTQNGLFELRQGKWARKVEHPFPEENGTSVQEDRKGNVWVGTWTGGLLRFGADGTLRRFELSGSPEPVAVRAVCEDHEGNLWVGLDGGGLCRLRRRVFRTFGGAQGLHGNLIRAAVEDTSGTMWVLNQGYVDWLHLDGNPLVTRSGLDVGYAWCALPGKSNDVWIAARGASDVFRCWPGGKEAFKVEGTSPALDGAVLFNGREDALWLGALNGLWRFQGGDFKPVALPSDLDKVDVRAIAEDKSGRLYVGLNGGGLLQRQGKKWTQFGEAEGFPDRRIWALYADAEDTIWIGSYGGGLSCFRHEKIFHFRDPALGLPSVVTSILEDADGNLWCGSNQGVFRVSRAALSRMADGARGGLVPIQFGRSDGLETTECTSGSQPVSWKGRDGRLWFCTVKGVSVVDPKELELNTNPPPVVIEEVLADEKLLTGNESVHPGKLASAALPDGSDAGKKDLSIPAGTDRIEIHFAALTFSAPAKTRFRYRLDNFDPGWVGGDTRRLATYTHVPPGAYEFHVIACNNNGVWNEEGAVLAFTVQPRFFQTWWFRLAATAFVAGCAVLAYHLRMNQLQEVSQLRLRIASDLHDEVGSNLGSIALNSELLQGNPALSPGDREELAEINRVAAQTTQTIREITWLINPGFDTLPEMTERMRIVAASMLSGREYEFSAAQTLTARKLSLEFRRHVFLIFKEILHNIVKHSGAKRVEISLGETAGRFELTVKDDGAGFVESAVRHGHGLASIRRRAEALKGAIEINSRLGTGTTIQLTARIR